MELDIELINSYCDEALDLLSRWETICLELSKNEDKELYQELFRIAHNIKGGSRAVGLMSYGDFVHKVEDGITLLRDGDIKLNPTILSLVLEAQKILVDWTAVLKLEPSFNYETVDFLKKFKNSFSENQSELTQNQPESTPEQNMTRESLQSSPAEDPKKIDTEKKLDENKKNTPPERKKESIFC